MPPHEAEVLGSSIIAVPTSVCLPLRKGFRLVDRETRIICSMATVVDRSTEARSEIMYSLGTELTLYALLVFQKRIRIDGGWNPPKTRHV